MAHPWPLHEPVSTFPSRTRHMYLYTRIISSCLRFRPTNRKTDNERSKIPTRRPDHARKQSSITLYYTTDCRGTENRRDTDDHRDDCTLYIPEFYYQIVFPTKSHPHENIVPGGMHFGCVLIKKTQNLRASSRISGTLVFLASKGQQ